MVTPRIVSLLRQFQTEIDSVSSFLIQSADAFGVEPKKDEVLLALTIIANRRVLESENLQPPMMHECVPISLLRTIATYQHKSLRTLLKDLGDEVKFALCPTSLPLNSHRAEMRQRISKIDRAVSDAEYNRLVPTQARVDVKTPFGSRNKIAGDSSTMKPEKLSSFTKEISIGIDMRLMSAAGAVVGYYLCYSRGAEREMCYVGAAVGAVVMLLVDALLLITRLAREDDCVPNITSKDPRSLEEKVMKATDQRAKEKLAAPLSVSQNKKES